MIYFQPRYLSELLTRSRRLASVPAGSHLKPPLALNGRKNRRAACVMKPDGMELEVFDMDQDEEEDEDEAGDGSGMEVD